MNRAPRFSPARLLAMMLAAWVAFADAVRGEEMSGAFLVRSWQSEDGLPGSIVRSVAQAVDGYLWVATAEGLVRFDGVRFTGFEAEPDATLARVPPRAVFALNDGDVWVATARGGLLRWHGGRLARVWQEADAAVPAAQVVEVSQVVGDGSGGAYIARGAELWRAADRTPQLAERTPEADGLLRSDAALSSRRSSAGMGARMHDRRGRVWAAEADGLSVADAEGRTERVALPMVETNRINELLEDREGSVWVATGESGLRQIRERRVEVLTTADGLSDRAVGVVMEDRAGAWWLGGKRGGLDRRDGGGVRHFDVGDGSENRPVSAIFEGRVSGMWAATRNGSVFRLEKGLFAPVAGMPGKVIAMAEDAAGRLWFGGSQGVAVWSGGTLTRFGAEEGFTGGEVTALASDAAGALWVGTGGGQVFRGRNGRFENIAAVQRAVSTMLPDADGSLWVTTLGSGLWHWRRGAPAHFAAGEGLPDSRLTCALDDGAGHLWLGSLGGIFRVEKAALAQIEARKSTAAHWLQFDRSDGLLTRECTGGFQPAGWRGRSGELWFPTVNGVVRIQPAALALNAAPPPVVIEECRADGRVLSIGGAAPRIGPGRPRMEFRYTGLSFAAPEKVRFRLRLEGLEDEWRDAGAARTAAYEAVPPGRYRFQVRGGVGRVRGAAVFLGNGVVSRGGGARGSRDRRGCGLGDHARADEAAHRADRASARAGGGALADRAGPAR